MKFKNLIHEEREVGDVLAVKYSI